MKKAAIIPWILIICLLLPSCVKKTEKLEKSEGIGSSEKFELSEKKSTVFSDIPFPEGCYAGNDYVIELVFTGRKNEYTYNVMMFRKDTGAAVFTGTAFDVDKDSGEFSLKSSSGTGTILTVSELCEGSIAVKMTYDGGRVPFVSGEYEFIGEKFVPNKEKNGDILSDGSYTSENGVYILNIFSNGNTMDFSITDTYNTKQVFLGRLMMGFEHETAIKSAVLFNIIEENAPPEMMKENGITGNEKVELTKSNVNGVACVEVTEHSIGSNGGFSGKYYYNDPNHISNGEYRYGERTVRVSRATVKSKHQSGEQFRYTERITICDDDGKILFTGTKELAEKEEISYAEFVNNGAKIIFYKGYNDEGEYIEVMNCGYIDGMSVNNRYRLVQDN